MSTKKIVVPDGMVNAVYTSASFAMPAAKKMLEAGMLWLSNNPVMPDQKQRQSLTHAASLADNPHTREIVKSVAIEWQRIIFLAPEPETPEEVKDLLAQPWGFSGTYDGNIIEAFRRGQKAGQRS